LAELSGSMRLTQQDETLQTFIGDGAVAGLLDAAMNIAVERRKVLGQMRDALIAGDDPTALKCARRLCGLRDEASN